MLFTRIYLPFVFDNIRIKHHFVLIFWIYISIWATAHLPLPQPNINPNLLSIDCCWVRGGVGGHLPRYWYWSNFFSQQRVLLFNAFATSAMCRANVPVLDVHPLTDSYPYGTGTPSRPRDAVHYEHFVFESAERLLEDYFYRTYKREGWQFLSTDSL